MTSNSATSSKSNQTNKPSVDDVGTMIDVLGLDLAETVKPAGGQAADASGPSKSGPAPTPKKTTKPAIASDEGKEAARKKPIKGSRKEQNTSRLKKASKTETLLAVLERSKGASLDELMNASGWQAHSVRGFLSAVVKKKLRLKLSSETDDKGVRRYRVKSRAKA